MLKSKDIRAGCEVKGLAKKRKAKLRVAHDSAKVELQQDEYEE